MYELNTSARKIRLQSAISLVEQTVVPVVKSKVTEVRKQLNLSDTKNVFTVVAFQMFYWTVQTRVLSRNCFLTLPQKHVMGT